MGNEILEKFGLGNGIYILPSGPSFGVHKKRLEISNRSASETKYH